MESENHQMTRIGNALRVESHLNYEIENGSDKDNDNIEQGMDI